LTYKYRAIGNSIRVMNTVNNWKFRELTLKSWLNRRLRYAIKEAIGIVYQPGSGGLEAHPTKNLISCGTGILPVTGSGGLEAHPTKNLISCGTGILPVTDIGATSGLKLTKDTCRHQIPLNRAKNSTRVLYVSAIALKLAEYDIKEYQRVWQQTPQAIATRLVETLQPLCSGDFTIAVAPSGIIQFELTDLALAVWLQRLAQTALPLPESQILSPVVPVDRLFPIQYSHARCCSLLRMAHRDRIIAIVEFDRAPTPQIWSLSAPTPIPWLDEDGRLRLVHPAEYNLISQLLAVLDSLAPIIEQYNDEKPVNYLKLANSLSAAFQTFYSQCRIWGEVKIETPKLAQARLGLVLATQSLLRFILEDLLNAVAPLEL